MEKRTILVSNKIKPKLNNCCKKIDKKPFKYFIIKTSCKFVKLKLGFLLDKAQEEFQKRVCPSLCAIGFTICPILFSAFVVVLC